MSGVEAFLKYAEKNGWILEKNGSGKYHLPEIYHKKIGDFEKIISEYKCIRNKDNTTFFVLGETLCDETETSQGFSWDTFKKISLGACDGENEVNEVKQWWDSHFPVVMSVACGYEFYSLNTLNGSVEWSCEPMFEEAVKAADSLDDFFEKIANGTIEF